MERLTSHIICAKSLDDGIVERDGDEILMQLNLIFRENTFT